MITSAPIVPPPATGASGMQDTTAAADAAAAWREARDVADQFERLFVQQMVAKMRESASLGQEGGMFGNGPGAGTYTDMFDGNLAEHLTRSGGVGIADVILRDLVRLHQLPPEPRKPVLMHVPAAPGATRQEVHLVV